ncbi:MAG TPA: putative 4-mercaptohistidine N1-methyltransferase [Luteolibacter sp.]|nr:putative 4-mercaptohistidine N1-methyltransferase [Luteolibacter sp.]
MSEIYETDKVLSEYLLFHYGSAAEILPHGAPAGMREALDFPCRTVARFTPGHVARGLDLGCAVGRSAFEMARHCEQVTGIDFSHAFIRAAQALQRGEVMEYERLDEGNRRTPLMARTTSDIDASRLHFMQGDAMRLPDDLGAFDRVHAANLLCRLREPLLLLERLPSLVKPGGELVLATPCTWLEEYTPRENWPAGNTLDWLAETLTPHFTLIDLTEEPFLIRETARKFQWTSSQASLWRRRA